MDPENIGGDEKSLGVEPPARCMLGLVAYPTANFSFSFTHKIFSICKKTVCSLQLQMLVGSIPSPLYPPVTDGTVVG